MPWWLPIGAPKTSRVLTYSVARSSAKRARPVEKDAAMIRSGFRPANSCTRPASSSPTSASAGSRTSSMKTWNCCSGLTISIGIGVKLEARRVRGYDEQARLELAGLGVLGPRDDEHVLGLVDAGDVDLLALEQPLVTVAPRGGGDVVRVGAGVRLGDREGHRLGAVADARAATSASAPRCRTG